jgi:hypothetical protein
MVSTWSAMVSNKEKNTGAEGQCRDIIVVVLVMVKKVVVITRERWWRGKKAGKGRYA